jgi:hypothetical protein
MVAPNTHAPSSCNRAFGQLLTTPSCILKLREE